jgi:hypothetical protein
MNCFILLGPSPFSDDFLKRLARGWKYQKYIVFISVVNHWFVLRFIAVRKLGSGLLSVFNEEEREQETIPTEGSMGADWKGILFRVKFCL